MRCDVRVSLTDARCVGACQLSLLRVCLVRTLWDKLRVVYAGFKCRLLLRARHVDEGSLGNCVKVVIRGYEEWLELVHGTTCT